MQEATFLTRFTRPVTVVHRRSTLRASKVMKDRALSDDENALAFAFDSEIAEIAEIKECSGMLSGVVLRGVFTGATRELNVTGLLIAIGHDPRTELFTGRLDLDGEGRITAAGIGAAAALDAGRYLAARGAAETEPTTTAVPA